MSEVNHYRDLDLEQALRLKEEKDQRYWQAMDALGSISVDRAMLYAHIQELERGDDD